MLKGKGQYIEGLWLENQNQILKSFNPATGQLLWQGSHANAEDIRHAFKAAQDALTVWMHTEFTEKINILQRFAAIVQRNSTSLAQLISLETGKPLWESLTEVKAVISKIDLSIQAYKDRSWPKEIPGPDAKSFLRYKPHGIVVVLGVFNFPAHISNGHIIPALLAGNTVIYKPSEHTPAVAEFIMQCWHDSGIPPGIINCLQGDASCAQALLQKNIQGVYFTGSYTTGLKIHQQFSSRPEVILALEMGGNNPLVIGEITDIKAAVYQALLSTYITAGQRCTCARRIILPQSTVGKQFLQQFIQASQSLRVGPPTERPEVFIGPVISNAQALNALNAQEALITQGGITLQKMRLLKENTGLLKPGIVDMTPVITPTDEEIFAPFVQIYFYKEFCEALELANQTKYGLSAGLLSDSRGEYERFYQSTRAGLINWNRPTTGASSALPFGGVGHSGNHRPSAYFAADYCAYPIASQEQENLCLPQSLLPGISL
jgi:succinylglutamic semialdehyde dehydrogenase